MTTSADWRGRVGSTWAAEWRRTERAFAGVASALDAAIMSAAPASGCAVDIGCGVGSTTLALAAGRPGLRVTGIDLSDSLVAVARVRLADTERAGVTDGEQGGGDVGGSEADRRDCARTGSARGPVAFRVGDAAQLVPALAPLDLVVSRHGLMFFDDPRGGFAALARAARPGAPLVFSCFRARAENDWAVMLDAALGRTETRATGYAPGPYALADRSFTGKLLAEAGWRDATATALDVAYVVGAGDDPVADALGFFRRIGPAAAVLAAVATEERDAIEARLAALLGRRIRDGAVAFTASIWIWVARAGELS